MYISEFWCGVIVTVGIEFLALMVIAIWQSMKKKRGANE